MRRRVSICSVALLILLSSVGCDEEAGVDSVASSRDDSKFPELSGPYLGMTPPGEVAELFAPGIVSTPYRESSCSFSPDGKTLMIGNEGAVFRITYMEEIDGRWTEPRLAPFSGKNPDFDFNYAPTGNQFLYSSITDDELNTTDVWVVSKGANGWSDSTKIDYPVNTDANDHHPSVTRDGVLYFHSNREGGFGDRDIYRSVFENGSYQEPENLGPNVNSSEAEGDACISPDEDYLIFGTERSDSLGDYDLYISFRLADNSWTPAVNMGPQVNTPSMESCPNITADGRYFFFTSRRQNPDGYPSFDLSYPKQEHQKPDEAGNSGDIYWIDAKIVEKLRPKEQ